MIDRRRVDQARVALDVLDSLLEGCQVIGPGWTYLFLNSMAARQGGRAVDDLLGRTMMECYPGIERTPMFDLLRASMADRSRRSMENEFRFPDGSVGWFELRFIPVTEGVCILSVDITERKRAQAALERTEAQFRQAHKMDAIGRLAGGVAHDFNNLLSVILSYAELATEQLGPHNPATADIEQITAAGRRAAELTTQLLSVSRHHVVDLQPLNLNDCTAGVAKMLKRVLSSDVTLRLATAPDLSPAFADPGQIEQVLMNLAINARDAMPDGGTLTIETANVDLDEKYTAAHLGTSPGRHVMLAVSDTGTGIDKETQSKIFEPFFTTKAHGQGTGLGLSIVYGIVQQSAGSIWVYSELGVGTTFKVYFPVTQVPGGRPVTDRPSRATQRSGGATILVVEDDPQLRQLVTSLLERDGHSVLAASTPEEALALAKSRGTDIDLFFTDLVLPGMHGLELARRAAEILPDLRTLFMSGFTDDVALRYDGISRARFVQKPFTPDRLVQAVRDALSDTVSAVE